MSSAIALWVVCAATIWLAFCIFMRRLEAKLVERGIVPPHLSPPAPAFTEAEKQELASAISGGTLPEPITAYDHLVVAQKKLREARFHYVKVILLPNRLPDHPFDLQAADLEIASRRFRLLWEAIEAILANTPITKEPGE